MRCGVCCKESFARGAPDAGMLFARCFERSDHVIRGAGDQDFFARLKKIFQA
jgi:hypothetical protein